ncbi:MAG: pyruvate formate lyase-activating protein, partial [Candidatus Odinarchaeota archaeon]
PTPNLYTILGALLLSDVNIAQIWNSNFYHSNESMSLLIDLIDLWLPDFKYGSDECAKRLSSVENYWTVITRNIKRAYVNVTEGLSSIIIRHLVLPNHYECCSKPVLEWIAKEIPNAPVNIMEQYRPCHIAVSDKRYSDVSRPVYREEVSRVRELADELGVNWRSVTH